MLDHQAVDFVRHIQFGLAGVRVEEVDDVGHGAVDDIGRGLHGAELVCIFDHAQRRDDLRGEADLGVGSDRAQRDCLFAPGPILNGDRAEPRLEFTKHALQELSRITAVGQDANVERRAGLGVEIELRHHARHGQDRSMSQADKHSLDPSAGVVDVSEVGPIASPAGQVLGVGTVVFRFAGSSL